MFKFLFDFFEFLRLLRGARNLTRPALLDQAWFIAYHNAGGQIPPMKPCLVVKLCYHLIFYITRVFFITKLKLTIYDLFAQKSLASCMYFCLRLPAEIVRMQLKVLYFLCRGRKKKVYEYKIDQMLDIYIT